MNARASHKARPGARQGNYGKSTTSWRKPYEHFDKCEECGAEPRRACRTQDDDVADAPCEGRKELIQCASKGSRAAS